MAEIVLKHKIYLKLLLGFLTFLTPLYLQAISSDMVNKLIQFNEIKNLKSLKTVPISKPTKKTVQKSSIKTKEIKAPKKPLLKQGKYESTKEFKIRVKTKDSEYLNRLKQYNIEKKNKASRVENLYKKSLKNAQLSYEKAVKDYNKKVLQQKRFKDKKLKNIKNLRGTTLDDALLIYLGKPKIKDFSNYNPDDEVFITKIVSTNLSLPIALHIGRKEAQKLEQSQQLKDLEPIVTFEYDDNHLYISEIKVKNRRRTFQTSLIDAQNYNTNFKLNYRVKNRFIKWSNRQIKDKDLIQKYSKIRLSRESHQLYTDKQHHLTWQDNQDVVTTKRTYDEASKYCKNLQLNNQRGWRLPTKKELFMIVDTSKYNPAVINTLLNTKSDYYWTVQATSDKASYIDFQLGEEGTQGKSNKNYVRCVLSTDFAKHLYD